MFYGSKEELFFELLQEDEKRIRDTMLDRSNRMKQYQGRYQAILRDEDVIAYYAVTPLMRKGYMMYRLFLPTLLCTVFSGLYLLFSGIVEIQLESLYSLLLLVLEAPCFALFLSAFSSNKVEGLALSKLGGLLMAGPVVAYFVPGGWQLLGAWIPSYWPSKVFLEGIEDRHLAALGYLGIGMLFHIFLLIIMVRAFIKRVN